MRPILEREALKPLRETLLGDAKREAEAVVVDAGVGAETLVAAATAAAEQLIRDSRARGEADAVQALAGDSAAVQQQARSVILRARNSLDEELRARTRAELRTVRNQPGFERLRTAIENHARDRLDSAAVSREPAEGGLVIEAPGRRIDASFDALADWAIQTAAAIDWDAP